MSQAGTNVTPHNYLRWHFQKLKDAENIKKGFHAFRHTHATELIAVGIPIPDVSRRLGHSRVSTTMDIYAHVLPKNDDKMINVIDEIFNKKPKKKDETTSDKIEKDVPN